MIQTIKSGDHFVNLLNCPKCSKQVAEIEPVETENPFIPLVRRVQAPKHIGYDLKPCGCFLSAPRFTLIFRTIGDWPTVEFTEKEPTQ